MHSNQMKKSITNYIFIYWLALLLWQNLFSASLRGLADTLIKVTLLVYLISGFSKTSERTSSFKGGVLLFTAIMMFSFFINDLFSEALSATAILNSCFPCIYVYLVFCMGEYIEITDSEVRSLNKKLIFVTFIAVLYTLIFERAQFSTALSATNGYGNELHGFFTGMFEFSLYLFYASAGCIKEIDERKKNGGRHIILYYVLMALFLFTMVLTFCRTTIACCVVYLIIFSILNKNSSAGKMILFVGLIIIVLYITVPRFQSYLFETVWKSGISNSRERLFSAATQYYKNSPIFNKIFGSGISETREFFKLENGYGSIHNGYLQVLLYNGWFGILWIAVLAIAQLRSIKRCWYLNRSLAIEALGFLCFALVSMLPCTVIVFYSSIDAFFLTTFMIVIPRFRMNYVLNCSARYDIEYNI